MSWLYLRNFLDSGSSSQLLQLQKGMHRKEDLWPTELTKRQEDQAMKIDRSPRSLDSKSRRQVRPPPHHTAQLLVVSHLSLHLHVTHTRVPIPGRSITWSSPGLMVCSVASCLSKWEKGLSLPKTYTIWVPLGRKCSDVHHSPAWGSSKQSLGGEQHSWQTSGV